MKNLALLTLVLVLVVDESVEAQPKGYLYDEEKVVKYDLPDVLRFENGDPVKTKADWQRRHDQLLKIFESQVYGRAPERPETIKAKMLSRKEVLDGEVIMEQVAIDLTESGPTVTALVFRPKSEEPVPTFLGLNFNGNHTVFSDEDILVTKSWVRNSSDKDKHKATPADRGKSSGRWPVKLITSKGFALVTIYYGDIDPDFDDGFKNGVHGKIKAGKSETPAADEWGSIAGWAWSLSRVLDAMEHQTMLDAKKVFVIGHSRLGKTAIWAGASDKRFAGVISNNSGCGGAALSKRKFGETVKRINTSFPHWFCDHFNQYNDKEEDLPVDQHMLISLCAPRPVYVASASDDLWADPMGEFLSIKHASKVYELLGKKGLAAEKFPEVNQPSIGTLSYHRRKGKHDLTSYDWEQYIKFARLAISK